jgi:hypothetical protein
MEYVHLLHSYVRDAIMQSSRLLLCHAILPFCQQYSALLMAEAARPAVAVPCHPFFLFTSPAGGLLSMQGRERET